jgi:hypothetical protein
VSVSAKCWVSSEGWRSAWAPIRLTWECELGFIPDPLQPECSEEKNLISSPVRHPKEILITLPSKVGFNQVRKRSPNKIIECTSDRVWCLYSLNTWSSLTKRFNNIIIMQFSSWNVWNDTTYVWPSQCSRDVIPHLAKPICFSFWFSVGGWMNHRPSLFLTRCN